MDNRKKEDWLLGRVFARDLSALSHIHTPLPSGKKRASETNKEQNCRREHFSSHTSKAATQPAMRTDHAVLIAALMVMPAMSYIYNDTLAITPATASSTLPLLTVSSTAFGFEAGGQLSVDVTCVCTGITLTDT